MLSWQYPFSREAKYGSLQARCGRWGIVPRRRLDARYGSFQAFGGRAGRLQRGDYATALRLWWPLAFISRQSTHKLLLEGVDLVLTKYAKG